MELVIVVPYGIDDAVEYIAGGAIIPLDAAYTPVDIAALIAGLIIVLAGAAYEYGDIGGGGTAPGIIDA